MNQTLQNRYPALVALLLQITAFAVIAGLFVLNSKTLRFEIPLWLATISQGLLAAFLAWKIKLPRWWIPINLFFLPLIAVGAFWKIPQWVYFLFFSFILLLNWNSFRERVPLYLTSHKGNEVLDQILRSLGHEKFSMIDLGCGLAGSLRFLSRKFPQARFIGVETAPMTFLMALIRSWFGKYQIRYQDIWKVNLSEFDVVYCFLSPAPMPKIWEKALQEMKPGTLLLSNTFQIPGVKPMKTVKLKDWREGSIFIYSIPPKV